MASSFYELYFNPLEWDLSLFKSICTVISIKSNCNLINYIDTYVVFLFVVFLRRVFNKHSTVTDIISQSQCNIKNCDNILKNSVKRSRLTEQ